MRNEPSIEVSLDPDWARVAPKSDRKQMKVHIRLKRRTHKLLGEGKTKTARGASDEVGRHIGSRRRSVVEKRTGEGGERRVDGPELG